jgi:hypothetical protein
MPIGILPVIVRVTESPPWTGRQQEHDRIMRVSHQVQGEQWCREMLPLHFEHEAHGRYGYQQRKDSTISRKLNAAKHGRALPGANDLIFSGVMKAAVLGYQNLKPRGGGVSVLMYGPKYLWMFNKREGQPDKAAEITRVTGQETSELEKTLDEQYHIGANAINQTVTTVIGSP